MIDTSPPIVFRRKIEWMWGSAFLLVGLFFFALNIAMIMSGERSGWFGAVFFGLIPCVCFLRLLPNCAFLRVSHDGVELCEWFRSFKVHWDQIASVDYIAAPSGDTVEIVVAETDPDPQDDEEDRIPIPPVYGAMPVTLANLLNDWRRAVKNEASDVIPSDI